MKKDKARSGQAERKPRRLSLTRAERAKIVKRRLYEAAVMVVGEHGYAGATVSRITNLAQVAQGTFYNYFPNRQDLLEQLLPTLGQDMLDFIRDQVKDIDDAVEMERARFRAFFDFLIEKPQFMRILYEAQLYAPKGYEGHMQNVTQNYIRALQKGGLHDQFTEQELKVVTLIMMGARSYLSHAFAYDGDKVNLPCDAVFSAYDKLMRHGLFNLAV